MVLLQRRQRCEEYVVDVAFASGIVSFNVLLSAREEREGVANAIGDRAADRGFLVVRRFHEVQGCGNEEEKGGSRAPTSKCAKRAGRPLPSSAIVFPSVARV